jgi:Tol biopolymer transport system component
MTVVEGGACTSSDNCMAGLRCETSGNASTCQPLHLAMTRALTGGATEAVVVRYKTPGSEPATGTTSPTKLSESTTAQSRYPRWNKEGTAVAFVEEATADAPVLVSRNLPLATGQQTTLVTGADVGTVDFRYMEWEPSNNIAWVVTTKAGNNYTASGISYVAGTGGGVQSATTSGVFPSWAADGSSFAYSSGGLGLRTKMLGAAADAAVTGASATSEQPLYNKANGVLLYLDAAGKVERISGEDTPLTELFSIRPVSATEPAPAPVSIAAASDAPVTGGNIRSYIANHTWAPGGTHVAYVRTYYLKPTAGPSVLCSGANCGGQQGNVVYVRRIGANGAPEEGSAELLLASEATLPSFSPDGHFIAYLSGSQLRVQRIDPAATTEASFKVGSAITHTWTGSTISSNRGDDHRPRWQPR